MGNPATTDDGDGTNGQRPRLPGADARQAAVGGVSTIDGVWTTDVLGGVVEEAAR